MNKEVFWAENLKGLITDKNYFIIIPVPDMSFEEKLNAATRFAIYFTLVMFLVKKDTQVLVFFVIFMIGTLFLYNYQNGNQKDERFVLNTIGVQKGRDEQHCMKPTKDNPFMNVSFNDYKTFPNRPQACDVTNPKIKHQVNKFFKSGLHHEHDDIFQRKTSDRQFYTNPITTIPNDQDGFAKWLYHVPGKTCKEGNGQQCTVVNQQPVHF